MARVYRAWDERLSAWRAIKAMAPEYAGKKSLRQRFRREAQAMASLEHPNIVRVYDVVDEGEVPFIVMELVEGGSLEDWVERNGKMPPRLAISAMLAACAGVQAAHNKGVIHRDLKPANVLVGLDGRCRIADFGIAHLDDDASDAKKTKTGMMMGTMGYMAPEQSADAKRADARSDIYALGATLLHLLNGVAPIHMFSVVEPTVFDGVPAGLSAVLKRATEARPDARYATVEDFAAALAAAMDSVPAEPGGAPPLAAPARAAPPIPTGSDAPRAVPTPPRAPAILRPPVIPRTPVAPPPNGGPAAPTVAPPVAGETTAPLPDEEPADVKLQRLRNMAGYAKAKPAEDTTPKKPVLATDKAYDVDDSRPTGLRPELIELTDEERRLAEEARRRQWEQEQEATGLRRVQKVGLEWLKFLAEQAARVGTAILEIILGKGMIVLIPAAILSVMFLVKGNSTKNEMAEVEVQLVDSRASLVSAMEADPELGQDLISLGASAMPIERAQQKLKDTTTEADRGAAASDLIHILQLQYDKLMKKATGLQKAELEALRPRMEKVINACLRYDADRFGLTELCESWSGQVVAGFGIGPCAQIGE